MDRPSRPKIPDTEPRRESPGRKKRTPSRERKSSSPSRARGRPRGVKNSPDAKKPRSPSRGRGKSKSPVRNAKPKKSVSPPKVSPQANNVRSSMSPTVRVTRATFSSERVTQPESKIEEIGDSIAKRLTRYRASAEKLISEVKGETNHKLNVLSEKSDSLPRQILRSVLYLSLMVATPALVIVGQLACTKDTCLSWPPKVARLTWKRVWDRDAALWLAGYLALHLVLTALPLGPKFSNKTSRRRSGPANVLIVGAVLASLHFYFKFPLTKVLDKSLPILIASVLVGIILSLVVYFKNLRRGKFNASELTKDLFVGVESNPTLGPFDLKIAITRACYVTTIIYNGLLILKELELSKLHGENSSANLNIVLLTACAFEIIYSLDFLLFECLTTYTISKERTGYWFFVYYLAFPFWVTLIPKFLFLARGEYEHWKVFGSAALFLLGYITFRFSSYKKSAFKNNIDDVPLCDIVGGRHSEQVLYRGNLWSVIRHPNYFGVILQIVALTSLALASASLHWIPIVELASCIIDHLVRINIVESATSASRKSVWYLYQNQVKYKLIPRVY